MALIRRILLPTDLGALSRHAAPLARRLAELCGAELHVLYVAEPAPLSSLGQDDGSYCLSINPTDAELTLVLGQFVESTLPGAAVQPHVARGLPAAQIVDFVRAQAIDLVVMGTHARGVVKRLFLGSVSKTVLENAGCAVLMVPATADVGEEDRNVECRTRNATNDA
ncbi:Universal stress protein family protein [Phycisphaerae bacterium RAS1]|nr:Universal stress protein family protein [Phycisphaerae bacterium RAS1]